MAIKVINRKGKRKPRTHERRMSAVVAQATYKPRPYSNGHEPPCVLTKPERHAWDTCITILPWLLVSDLPCAAMWCKMWVRWEAHPNPSAASYTRLSRLGSMLGLSPLGRAHLGIDIRRPHLSVLPPPSKATHYFEREPDGAA